MGAEQCPGCGGGLLVSNQDGWKICHSCGYPSPPGAAQRPVCAARAADAARPTAGAA
ncbi:hypothetical protein RKE29_17825 [Streptomyces sp. B1866]|uniref:hypothetical protein n=1 Tax=Streptomyces sp. B1866 TaxID=3075431 RepID=UPI002891F726|nr:hypothetical protein [Streptomyces sp. B1866]MDT3398484.1 hypothetical protein [Streptomyces sp. B1866]